MNTENRYPVTASLFMLREIKHRQEQVKRGYQLLRRKSEALRIRGRHVAAELTATQAILGHTLREAYISLAAIKFTNGESNAMVLENVGQAQIRVQRIPENISGVATVTLQAIEDTGVSDVLLYSGLGSGGHRTGEAKKAFREVLLILIKFASLRNTCILLDEAIRTTLRKVNGIEKVIIPKLRNTETYILMEMDEREREDFHRLKMVKAKKLRIQATDNLRRLKSRVGAGESSGRRAKLFILLGTRNVAAEWAGSTGKYHGLEGVWVSSDEQDEQCIRQPITSLHPSECLTNILHPYRTPLSSSTDSAGDYKPICYPHHWDDDDLLF